MTLSPTAGIEGRLLDQIKVTISTSKGILVKRSEEHTLHLC